jgi:Asp-tRNA(Asn)/Glu-tRNA(Gln) amidotransferase B subunit
MDTKEAKKKMKNEVKKVVKVVDANLAKAKKKGAELETVAIKEFKKIQKEMEITSKKVAAYIKKNPERAAMITAGVGAALGTVVGLFIGATKGKTKGKKK